jgi:uncharacterized membrane protein required for colicin V production
MIPVEYLWLALILTFGLIGMSRGPTKELGVTTVLLLSLFTLRLAWNMIGAKVVAALPGNLSKETIEALYYIIPIVFIAIIAYEGFALKFPLKEMKGIKKAIFGFLVGLLNGYLIVGTVWDATYLASYFGIKVPYGTTGTTIQISSSLTELHNTLANYLPLTLNPYILLALGMILLLLMILK